MNDIKLHRLKVSREFDDYTEGQKPLSGKEPSLVIVLFRYTRMSM